MPKAQNCAVFIAFPSEFFSEEKQVRSPVFDAEAGLQMEFFNDENDVQGDFCMFQCFYYSN